jgi:metallo-beta-lactamase class B
MKKKLTFGFIPLLFVLIFGIFTPSKGQNVNEKPNVLSLDQAAKSLTVIQAAARIVIPDSVYHITPPSFQTIEPVKLFDNLYFVGTSIVGSYLINTEEGLILIDTGLSDIDAAVMVNGIKKLGLDPSGIKVIFISHEHVDHYGGVQYFLKNACPDAKVAMSLIGWNMLQAFPYGGNYGGLRPQNVDIYLIDGMKIKIGEEIVQIVSTPGHSPGCVSFIFQVRDNGIPHMVGIMGGTKVWPTQVETRQYKSSIEYFKAFAGLAKCDIGLNFHAKELDFASVRLRKNGEPNPLIIGTDKFNSVYLQSFRDLYKQMLESGKLGSDQ